MTIKEYIVSHPTETVNAVAKQGELEKMILKTKAYGDHMRLYIAPGFFLIAELKNTKE